MISIEKPVEKKRNTIKEVSKLAGVSTATVSRYLNSSGYVDESTAQKLQKVIEKINYTPNRIAKRLKTQRSQQLMLVVPNITNPYYSEMFKVLQSLAQEQDYSVILFDTSEDEDNELKCVKISKELGVDGIIFCSIDRSMKVYEELKKIDIPIVISNLYDDHAFDTLHSIGGKGIYIAAKHLIEYGHRKLAYVGGPEGSAINQRRKNGFLFALQEEGIEPNKDWIFEMDFSMETGYKAGKYLSSLKELPTGICAANDIIAMGVILAFNESGIKIPEDVSLTGEDNIEFSRVCHPTLTTVDNSGAYFAEHAFKIIFERINGTYTGTPREIVCPRELIVRASTRRI